MDKKEMSARKFMVVCFTVTFCLLNISNAVLTIMKLMPLDVYIACWGSFNAPMVLIADWYFKRDDRQMPDQKAEPIKQEGNK